MKPRNTEKVLRGLSSSLAEYQTLVSCLPHQDGGQREGSEVQRSCCSSREPGFPATMWRLTTILTPVLGDQRPPCGPQGTRHAHGAQTYMQIKHPYTYIQILLLNTVLGHTYLQCWQSYLSHIICNSYD